MPALQETVWPRSQDYWHVLVDEGILLQALRGWLCQGKPAAGEAQTVSFLSVAARIVFAQTG